MNNKYVITIDGPDCTGKSTLWLNAISQGYKDIQIRGIVSNIAYAIKYERDVESLIKLYNKKPINYCVYLLNQDNYTKIKFLNNRLNNICNDSNEIIKELNSLSNSWNDNEYFVKAINILKEKYKGNIKIINSNDVNVNNFINTINNIEKYSENELDELLIDNPSIKVLNTMANKFENEAKIVSEYKYIVLLKLIMEVEVND